MHTAKDIHRFGDWRDRAVLPPEKSNEETIAEFVADIERVREATANREKHPPCASCGHELNASGQCYPCEEQRSAWKQRVNAALGPNAHFPKRFDWARFSDPALRQRVKSAQAIEKASKWSTDALTIVGPVGTGKTSLAHAAARERTRRDDTIRDVLFVDAFELSVARRHLALGEGEAHIVDRALSEDLAIIDDVGSEPRDHASTVAHIVFERHQQMLLTIVTTWCSPAEIANMFGAGISRRIFETAVVLNLGGRP